MPASACVAAIVVRVLFVPVPTISGAPARRTHARARVDDRALLVGVERGRLAGRAEGDDAGRAGGEVLAAQPLDRVDVDRAVGVERGDQRDPDTAEVEVARHGRKA